MNTLIGAFDDAESELVAKFFINLLHTHGMLSRLCMHSRAAACCMPHAGRVGANACVRMRARECVQWAFACDPKWTLSVLCHAYRTKLIMKNEA